ncbi:MAG: cysteate synthase, partial [Bacteroidales bacterium]|nr:cysteate synthase [Bacteroidales bacterium]
QILFWQKKYLELEGIDIYSAAAVAVASLEQAVSCGAVEKDEVIMLNITGGGDALSDAEHRKTFKAIPDLILDNDTPAEDVVASVDALFGF